MNVQSQILEIVGPSDAATNFADHVSAFMSECPQPLEIIAKVHDHGPDKKEFDQMRAGLDRSCQALLLKLEDFTFVCSLNLPEPVLSSKSLVGRITATRALLDEWRHQVEVMSESTKSPLYKNSRKDLGMRSKEVVSYLAYCWWRAFQEHPKAWESDASGASSKFCEVTKLVLAELKLKSLTPKTVSKIIKTIDPHPLLLPKLLGLNKPS